MECFKTIQKSIRLKPETLEIIESQEGESFNEKLEKIIYKYGAAEKDIDKRIAAKQRQLADMEEKLKEVEGFVQAIGDFKYEVKSTLIRFRRKIDNRKGD